MTWLRNRGNLGVLALVMGVWIISFSACNPEVVAHTKDVEITIDVEQVSAGFAQVRFSPIRKRFI